MTKQLIIGLATLSIAGAAVLGTGMYAATTSITSSGNKSHMEQQYPIAKLESIKTQVSTGAYTALETLMTKHKAEMDALKSSTTNADEATIKAKHEAFKTEMDALLTQYPELKSAMPQGNKMNGRGGRGGVNPMDEILASVSQSDKAAIEAIHTEYSTKAEALHTEEKAKIDAIIAKYPELKTKLDTLKANKPSKDEGKGRKMSGRGMMKNNQTSTNTTIAQ